MRMTSTSEIEYKFPSCPRCGSSCDWEDCDECDEGFIEDDDPNYVEPELLDCPNCQAKGGWWRCTSTFHKLY